MNKLLFQKAWESPTLMTWLSYSTKALTLFGVLPLVLKRFSAEDIVLWYLFSTIITLQGIADFGFRQTFSRIISYAYGGASEIGVFTKSNSNSESLTAGPNLRLLESVTATMRVIYKWLTVVLLVLLVSLGTWSLHKPVQEATDVMSAWVCWGIVIFISCLGFYGKIYLNFLEGLNKIALVRRVESLTSTGSIICSILVLVFSPSLLNLVIANQLWVGVATLRDWYLCRQVDSSIYLKLNKKSTFDWQIFQKIWQPAWRTGISGFMSVGLTNITGLVYAQVGNTSAVASYLLALRIINQIKEISMAPFYSKLPLLAIMRVKADLSGLRAVASRGMLLSHLTFLIGFIVVGLFSKSILQGIGSEVAFVSPLLWASLGLAFFVHRFGAMHIQIYLSTNHIISHIADGISGIIYIVSSLVLINWIGIYAIPVGMLAGYLGFYAWYAAKFSYSSLGTNFWHFEKRVSIGPGLLVVVYLLYLFYLG